MAAVEAGFEQQVIFLEQLVRHASLRNQESGVQAWLGAAGPLCGTVPQRSDSQAASAYAERPEG